MAAFNSTIRPLSNSNCISRFAESSLTENKKNPPARSPSPLGMVQTESYFSVKNSTNMIMNGHSSIMNNYGTSELPTFQNSNLRRSSSGLVHDPGFAVDWSEEEQALLDEGLVRFAHEPPVMKYVKIAGLLTDKTTRDVAMRCNWMKKKRRKQNQPNADKKMGMRQDVPLQENLPAASQLNMAQYSHLTHNMNQTKQLPNEAYHGPLQQFLQENVHLLSRIGGNLSAFKVQENVDLILHTLNNFTTIMSNMKDLRGTSSPMPPLPVSINLNLLNAVLQDPSQSQATMFGFPNCPL